MSDSTTASRPVAAESPKPEPPSTTAPAPARGHSLWARLKSRVSLRPVSLRDDLEDALEAEAAGETADFSLPERTILQNVLQLGDKHVEDVMVPRADIEAIDIECTLGDMIARFRKVGHSRIPVYDDNIDNITGFIHVKDALRRITAEITDPDKKTEMPIRLVSPSLKARLGKLDIVRQVLFVPPLMPVGDLLQQMQLKRVHMAIVIDEYGGTDGVVTIEDLLEAVVGEIEDEHDEDDEPGVVRQPDGSFVADARAPLEDVVAMIGADFELGDAARDVDTLGGYLTTRAGRVPVRGELVSGPGLYEIEVVEADPRRVKRVRIYKLKERRERTRRPDAITNTPPISPASEPADGKQRP
jgi:CBS domain containing-hemolysin-like protein